MRLFNRSRIAALLVVVTGLIYFLAYFDLYSGKSLFIRDAIIWYGSFHYYVESIISGHFPYWDPYMMTGTYFYPTISLLGLLDPSVLVSALLVKLTSVSPLTVYIYFRLLRLVLCAAGAYYLFEHITGCRTSAALSACIFFFALSAAYCVTDGPVLTVYLTPFALYFLLKFFDAIKTTERYLYLSALALVTGITMNVYIPAYYLFNLIAFIVVLFVLRIFSLTDVFRAFLGKKLAVFSVAMAFVVLMMTAPPLMVMFRDASAGGELFPMVRIIQKNDGNFKKIMASEIGTDAVSNRFTNQQGVFSSYGNMVNMVFPDIFESVPFFANDLLAEIPQYIGIIPLLFAVFGFFYHESRYRYLAVTMMILVTVNMFSFYGMSGKPFNALQQVFNAIFPPLKMIEVREAFAPFFLLYLCMLLSMGLSIFFDVEKFSTVARKRHRQMIALCAAVVAFKVAITGYFAGKIFFASMNDLLVVVQVALFAGCIYLFARFARGRAGGMLYVAIVLVIFLDQYVYAKFNARYTLGGSKFYHEIVDIGRANGGSGGFQYFRDPLPSPPGVAFGESILKVKGAFSYGNNHAIFCTRRYYDFYTHVPPGRQLYISGIMYPILRFYPADKAVFIGDGREMLNRLVGADKNSLGDNLFLERQNNKDSAPLGPLELASFDQYADVPSLRPKNLLYSLADFSRRYGQEIAYMRSDPNRFLATPEYSVAVMAFSQNELVIHVRNQMDGFLFYNDGWSRYWKAFDGDKEIPIKIANYNSKAVYLPKGAHSVRFVFDPVHYKAGLVLYYAGLLAASGMVVFLYFRDKKKEKE